VSLKWLGRLLSQPPYNKLQRQPTPTLRAGNGQVTARRRINNPQKLHPSIADAYFLLGRVE